MKIIILDNYDSFTYNLYQQVARLMKANDAQVLVFRNDQISLAELEAHHAQGIIISPGPGGPDRVGICGEVLLKFKGLVPILGVCLGHQLIAYLNASKVLRSPKPIHGQTSEIFHSSEGLFMGLPSPLRVARYHSLAIQKESLSDEFVVDALSDEEVIMSIRHKSLPLWGIQFHPESFMTEGGDLIISNFIEICKHFSLNKISDQQNARG